MPPSDVNRPIVRPHLRRVVVDFVAEFSRLLILKDFRRIPWCTGEGMFVWNNLRFDFAIYFACLSSAFRRIIRTNLDKAIDALLRPLHGDSQRIVLILRSCTLVQREDGLKWLVSRMCS